MASIVTGRLLMLTGYASSVAFAIGDLEARNPLEGAHCRNVAGGLGLIPVLGSWLSMIVRGTCRYEGYGGVAESLRVDTLTWGWRTAEAILQAAGLSMIIAGVLGGRRGLAIDAATSISLGPGGVELTARF